MQSTCYNWRCRASKIRSITWAARSNRLRRWLRAGSGFPYTQPCIAAGGGLRLRSVLEKTHGPRAEWRRHSRNGWAVREIARSRASEVLGPIRSARCYISPFVIGVITKLQLRVGEPGPMLDFCRRKAKAQHVHPYNFRHSCGIYANFVQRFRRGTGRHELGWGAIRNGRTRTSI